MNRYNHERGQTLVEILIALALSAILLPALITGLVSSREGKVQQRERSQATALVREAREAVRQLRELGWSYVSVNGTYHPVPVGTNWTLVSGPESINGQTRSIVITDVYRDSSGNITASGGTEDPSTKKVTVTVSWNALFASSVTSVLYISRFTNQAFTQTSVADFTAGTQTNTTITNASDGEVTLGAGGGGDWCSPNLSITAIDLPKSGVANGLTAIEGRVFAGTGDNSSGVSFANVPVANTNPPTAAVAGTFDGYKTNAVFGETNYAYLATDTNSKEIEIIDLTNYDAGTGKYAEAGYFNAPGNGNGNGVVVSGSIGYMTDGDTLYNFDLTSKSGSRSILDANGVTLAGTGYKLAVVGNYAYVAIDSTTTQMQIVDISNSSNLTIVGTAQLNAQGAVDVFVNSSGTRAYIVTKTSASQNELFIIDVSTKSGSHSAIGNYDTSGMNPKGVTVVPGNKVIAVGTGGTYQYQVIDIVNETNPVLCTGTGRTGGLSIPTGVNGVASVVETDGDAYSYIITGDASSELKIIEGGPGGQYASSGSFESSIFDATNSASFNRFSVNMTKLNQTNIEYQMAVANAVSGSCAAATYTYVGPSLSTSTRFATSAAIPLGTTGTYTNPGRCMRYKVFFSTTDKLSSPVFSDVTVNFSP